MRFGIVVTDPSDWTARAIASGLERCGAEAVYLNFSELSAPVGASLRLEADGSDLFGLDGLVVRDLGRRGSTDVAFRFEALSVLQELGLPIVNPPQAISRAANKFATSIALHQSGVPHPRTLVTTSLSAPPSSSPATAGRSQNLYSATREEALPF